MFLSFRKLFYHKEFYINDILIESYPNDVIVILTSNCLIEITSIVVFCNEYGTVNVLYIKKIFNFYLIRGLGC